jgi:hypothetical protein
MLKCLYFFTALFIDQQHTTLHPTAGLLLSYAGLVLVCPWMGDQILLKNISQCPRAVIGDIALCRVLSLGLDAKQVS